MMTPYLRGTTHRMRATNQIGDLDVVEVEWRTGTAKGYGCFAAGPVRLELRILAPNPGFGNVARPPTSVIC